MEILQLLLVFAVIGFIFNLIANVFKSLTGKELSSETFEESKKNIKEELTDKVINSKPAEYMINGFFNERNSQDSNLNSKDINYIINGQKDFNDEK